MSGRPVVALQRLSQTFPGIPAPRQRLETRDLSLSTGRPPTTVRAKHLRYRRVPAAALVVSLPSAPPSRTCCLEEIDPA